MVQHSILGKNRVPPVIQNVQLLPCTAWIGDQVTKEQPSKCVCLIHFVKSSTKQASVHTMLQFVFKPHPQNTYHLFYPSKNRHQKQVSGESTSISGSKKKGKCH